MLLFSWDYLQMGQPICKWYALLELCESGRNYTLLSKLNIGVRDSHSSLGHLLSFTLMFIFVYLLSKFSPFTCSFLIQHNLHKITFFSVYSPCFGFHCYLLFVFNSVFNIFFLFKFTIFYFTWFYPDIVRHRNKMYVVSATTSNRRTLHLLKLNHIIIFQTLWSVTV